MRLPAWNAKLGVEIADTRPVIDVVGDEKRAVEPDSGFVDHCRADRANPAQRRVLRPADLVRPRYDGQRAFDGSRVVGAERIAARETVLAFDPIDLNVILVAVDLVSGHDIEYAGAIGRVDAVGKRI